MALRKRRRGSERYVDERIGGIRTEGEEWERRRRRVRGESGRE